MSEEKLKVAVVTGNHPYDSQGFHQLFRSLPGIDAYIQHIDNWAATADSIGLAKDNDFAPDKARASYDCVVFFHFVQGEPKAEGEEGIKWNEGNPKLAIDELGGRGEGIFILHHAVAAYLNWPVWSELVGIDDRKFEYAMDETVRAEIANQDHPICQGLEPFEIVDETYKMKDCGEECDVLLTTDNPTSIHTLAWARQHKESRVLATTMGHDNLVWANEGFRKFVERGIKWCAKKI